MATYRGSGELRCPEEYMYPRRLRDTALTRLRRCAMNIGLDADINEIDRGFSAESPSAFLSRKMNSQAVLRRFAGQSGRRRWNRAARQFALHDRVPSSLELTVLFSCAYPVT